MNTRVPARGPRGWPIRYCRSEEGIDISRPNEAVRQSRQNLRAISQILVALIDVAHWASEWPWLERAAARLTDGLGAQGRTVATAVSRQVTDPWRLHLP